MKLHDIVPKWLRSTSPAVAVRAADHTADTPENAPYWRRLGEHSSRNLAAVDHGEMVKACVKAAQADGMGRSHVRLVRSITVGAMEIDAQVECKDQTAQKRLADQLKVFWKDPFNRLDVNLGQFMAGLTTTGSLCLTLHTGAGSKLTRIGYIDPSTFVAPGVVTDPANVLRRMCVLRAAPGAVRTTIAHPIVQPDYLLPIEFAALAEGSAMKLTVGDQQMDVIVGAPCVYAGINITAPNQSVGISDLYPGLDVMCATNELVFGAMERSINLGAYSLHVKFPKGTSAKEITDRMAAIKQDLEAGSGRAVGTTEDIAIAPISAVLQAGEWATMEKMGRTSSLIALGPWPVHIFSEGAGTNVTAAAEQGSPVANFLLERQNDLRRLILFVCEYALRKYPEMKALMEANPDARVVLPLPTIVAKNTTRESNVLAVELTTLRTLYDSGAITLEAFRRESIDAAARYGFSLTPQDMPSEAEAKEKLEMQALTLAPMKPDAEDPDADPRGGKREDDEDKVAEGTPAKASTREIPLPKARRKAS